MPARKGTSVKATAIHLARPYFQSNLSACARRVLFFSAAGSVNVKVVPPLAASSVRDLATMVLDDRARHQQPQSHSHELSCDKGLEDASRDGRLYAGTL